MIIISRRKLLEIPTDRPPTPKELNKIKDRIKNISESSWDTTFKSVLDAIKGYYDHLISIREAPDNPFYQEKIKIAQRMAEKGITEEEIEEYDEDIFDKDISEEIEQLDEQTKEELAEVLEKATPLTKSIDFIREQIDKVIDDNDLYFEDVEQLAKKMQEYFEAYLNYDCE